MNLLLDTQVLVWTAFEQSKVPPRLRSAIGDPDNTLWFSAATIWELTIKFGSGGFRYDTRVLRRHALQNGYEELAVTGDHAIQVGTLPPLHKDPFDRILIAQAQFEGFVLLTTDRLIRQYPQVQLY